ncbi:MAG: glycosyltransferase [Desulfococcaceae bacterium]
MKICMFTNTYRPHVGGVARSVHFFAEDLRAKGHRVMIVAPTFPGTESLEENSEEVLRVPAIQNFNGSDFSVRIPLPFLIDEAIDEMEPDIIHSHHPFLLGDAAMRAAHRRRLPLVFTHHTRYEDYTHYVGSDSDRMQRFAIHLSTEYANLCHRVVAPSRSIARLLARRGVKRPVTEIPTGVDIAFFEKGDGDRFRTANGLPADAPVVGHLGRLAPEKNLEYLARAVARPLSDRPDAHFLVVGEGPSAEAMAEIFEEVGCADRLILAGRQTGRNLADAYAAMDLFAFASLSETQGMVLVEAMAAGKPVVALDAPGAREVVTDRENGRLLAAKADTEEFGRAVLELLDDPEERGRMAFAAQKTAGDLSRERCAERLTEVYAQLKREHTSWGPVETAFAGWDELLRAVRVEWELISQKASAAAHAVWTGED